MEDNAVLPYLDMPMQHVSSNVLKRMGRKAKYDRSALEETISKINYTKTAKTACGVYYSPWADEDGRGGVTIRTTLMVGFPGETEADFQELLSFLKGPYGHSLTHIGVFTFSPEPKARATKFPNQVVKRRRRRQIESVHTRNLKRRHQSLVDQEREIVVLVDHVDPEAGVVGRHPGQALGVDGLVTMLADSFDDDSSPLSTLSPGALVIAKVVGMHGSNLLAKYSRTLKSDDTPMK
jgi:ribosomal protein S12 methylthiotransferase